MPDPVFYDSGSGLQPLFKDNGSGVLVPAFAEDDPCGCCDPAGLPCPPCLNGVPERVTMTVTGFINCWDILNGVYQILNTSQGCFLNLSLTREVCGITWGVRYRVTVSPAVDNIIVTSNIDLGSFPRPYAWRHQYTTTTVGTDCFAAVAAASGTFGYTGTINPPSPDPGSPVYELSIP